MKRKIINKKHIIFGALLIGSLIFAGFALAESCPALTTVSGTTVTFVGELADMGGDATASGWFEYGQTTSYGQKTSEKTLTQEGIYCITVSGLSSCTTYHYKAAVRNSAGTSYGENKTFTTTCGPTVDIKANGSDGLIEISYNSPATLTWTSTNANYCSASGDWSGSKPTSGSQSTGNLISSKIYTLICTSSAGSASDSVTVNVTSNHPPVANAGPDKELYEGQSKIFDSSGWDPDGDPITYYWYCTEGYLSSRYIARPTFTAPQVSYDRTYTCTLTVSDDKGLTDSDSMRVKVKDKTSNISLDVKKSVKNVSRGDSEWYHSYRSADPGDELLFKIVVKSTGDDEAEDVKVRDTLPSNIIYQGGLEIDGVSNSRNITETAVNIGDLSPGQSKTITFEAKVASKEKFSFGTTELINTARAYTSEISDTDTFKVKVTRKAVAGAVTTISTGITNGILNSILLPLGIALLIVWIFRSKLVGLDKWAQKRKKEIGEYKAEKTLKRKIAQLKTKGYFKE